MQATDGVRSKGVQRPAAMMAEGSGLLPDHAAGLPRAASQVHPDRFSQISVSGPAPSFSLREVELLAPTLRRYGPLYDVPGLARLQHVRTLASSGRTFEELAALNVGWLHAQADDAGVSVGELVRGLLSPEGVMVGGALLSIEQRAGWERRLEHVIERIKQQGPPEVVRLITTLERRGGKISFEPGNTAMLDVVAYQLGDVLGVSEEWIEAAERHPRRVYANIVHELGGHLEYGAPLTGQLMNASLDLLPLEQQLIALSGPGDIINAYDYIETELYAELRELPFYRPEGIGDDPHVDVRLRLEHLARVFDPSVSEALVQGFRYRVQRDPRIGVEARRLLDSSISEVFGLRFTVP